MKAAVYSCKCSFPQLFKGKQMKKPEEGFLSRVC